MAKGNIWMELRHADWCVHMCVHRPLSVKSKATTGREGRWERLGRHSLDCHVRGQKSKKSKNSQFELDLLGYYESIHVKVGGYNLFY